MSNEPGANRGAALRRAKMKLVRISSRGARPRRIRRLVAKCVRLQNDLNRRAWREQQEKVT